MGARRVLITGADGYLGCRIAHAALARGDDVVLWVRGAESSPPAAKLCALEIEFGDPNAHIEFTWGDLEAPEPFARVDPSRIDAIVHCAAVTRFNVEAELAQRVNVDGTHKLLSFAERCPRLIAIDLLSTLYASGLATGRIEERVGDGRASFANHYESSKAAAEQLAAERFAHLPWRVLRVATVLADDESGAVTQYNAVHNTLRLFYYGLLSVMPGERQVVPYLITGDFATAAWSAIAARGELRRVYQIAHSKSESLPLERVIELVFDVFERDPAFQERRVLRPLFCDAKAFELLVESTVSFRASVLGDALSSVAPFARQLFVDKDADNANLRACMPDYRAPDAARLLERTCEQLVTTKWGRAARLAASPR